MSDEIIEGEFGPNVISIFATHHQYCLRCKSHTVHVDFIAN